jgi:hypothetical protein
VLVLLLLTLFIGIAIGLVRGGTLDALGRIQISRPLLFGAALLALAVGRLVPALHAAGWILATMLIALFTAANRRLPGLHLLLIGITLNAIVITANGGKMPVSLWGADRAGVPSADIRASDYHTPSGADTVLRPATDVIPLAFPSVPAVLSIGDVFIASGLGLFGAVAPVRARRTLAARRRGRAAHRRTAAAPTDGHQVRRDDPPPGGLA